MFSSAYVTNVGEIRRVLSVNAKQKIQYEREAKIDLAERIRSCLEDEDTEEPLLQLYFTPIPLIAPHYTVSLESIITVDRKNFNLRLVVDGFDEDDELGNIHVRSKNNISIRDVLEPLDQLFKTLLQLRLNQTGVGKIVAQLDEIKSVSSTIKTRCSNCRRPTKLYSFQEGKKMYGCLYCYEYLFEGLEEYDEFSVHNTMIDNMPWCTDYFVEENAVYNDNLYLEEEN
jgi:hypothetical protein